MLEFVEHVKEILLPFGTVGLFALAFIESSFFIVPPDVLLIPLCLFNPERALFYALVCTLGSVCGAVFGYYIGMKGGRPVLMRLAREDQVAKIQALYAEYGALAVGMAGFTPIPYKIFSISSGVFKYRLHPFIAVSLLSRGARFFLEAAVIMLYGDEMVSFISVYFGHVTLAIGALVTLFVLLHKRFKRTRLT